MFAIAAGCFPDRSVELQARFTSVHNTLVGLGHAQTGPTLGGSLGEGKEARYKVELGAGCSTFVALGGGALRNLDLLVSDVQGKRVAEDATKDKNAATRLCLERSGSYVITVRAAEGAGDYLLGQWSGDGSKPAIAAAGSAPAQEARNGGGTCESPNLLVLLDTPQTITGSTSRGESNETASCGGSDGKEVVFQFDLTAKKRVTVDMESKVESVLHLRREDCKDGDSEVTCADESSVVRRTSSSSGTVARLDEVLEPGHYFLFVDSGSSTAGNFKIDIAATDVPKLEEECPKARPLTSLVRENLRGGFNFVGSACGEDSLGRELLHRVDIPARSRVRIVEASTDFSPVVSVRQTCGDASSEVGCGRDSDSAAFTGLLDPGSYTVFADAEEAGATGAFTLSLETGSEHGTGIPGDGCGDATVIRPAPHTSVDGDTFLAKDDVAGKCTGQGAPDAVYRVEIPRRTRLTAKFTSEESAHSIVLQRTCGDRASEISCGATVDQVLMPGTYFLAVDGAKTDSFGKYTLDVTERDLAALESACNSATTLALGTPVKGSLSGPHRFTLACAGRVDQQNAADKVYKLTVNDPGKIRFELATVGWDGVIQVMRSCIDPNAGGKRDLCGFDKTRSPLEGVLEKGTYWVVVGSRTGAVGSYTLTARKL